MIRFSLICEHDHEFEGMVPQQRRLRPPEEARLRRLPDLRLRQGRQGADGARRLDRAQEGKIALAMNEMQKKAMAAMKALSEKMRENADYVGDKFAEEARKIHFGEADPRGIYGEATLEEARSLAEDGVGFMPIPVFPEDRN
ncbi:MAG: DUF1178 family protein [Asticcacaulis sp.]|nr:DUF1178 family protein [Asticcacaulis sp.]